MKRYKPGKNGHMIEDSRGRYVLIDDIVHAFIFEVTEVENGVAFGLLRNGGDGRPSFTLEMPIEEMGVKTPVEPGVEFLCAVNNVSGQYAFSPCFGQYCKWSKEQIDDINKRAAEMFEQLNKTFDQPSSV